MFFQGRRRTLTGPTREAFVYCDHLYHGPEDQWRLAPGNVTSSFSSFYKRLIFVGFAFFPVAEEDGVTEKQVPGYFKAEEDLKVLKDLGNFVEWQAHHTVARSGGGAIGVVLILPARTLLFLVGTSWTIFFFPVIKHSPANIHFV